MKRLQIDYYTDGFNVEHISCTNITIACATGKFSHENYFYYSFLCSMYNNWCNDTVARDEALKLLGLRMKPISVENSEKFISQISQSIDSGNPILLYSRYNQMFFASQYKLEDLPHVTMLIIDGYDNDKSTVCIRTYIHQVDFMHNISSNKEFFVEAFSYLYLKQEHIVEIWENSRKDGVEGVFALERYTEPTITCYKELVDCYLNNVNIRKNTYQNLKRTVNERDKKIVRRYLYHSIVLFCEVLKRYIRQRPNANLLNDKIEEKIQQFLIERNMLANRIMKHIFVNKGEIKNELMEELRNSDQYLYDLVSTVHSEINSMDKDHAMNFALNATVSADSENLNALASCAVNGKLDDDTDCWCSSYKWSVHWLVADLGIERTIRRFIVKHHPDKKKLVTREYKIEGSVDSMKWDTLTAFKDNVESVNEVIIDPVTYRYFRLHITKAGMDNAARIFSFEIY